MAPGIGKLLIVAGIVLVVLGVVLQVGGRIPWLGRLPGDIVVQRGGFGFSFPLTTGVLVSVALSLLVWLPRR